MGCIWSESSVALWRRWMAANWYHRWTNIGRVLEILAAIQLELSVQGWSLQWPRLVRLRALIPHELHRVDLRIYFKKLQLKVAFVAFLNLCWCRHASASLSLSSSALLENNQHSRIAYKLLADYFLFPYFTFSSRGYSKWLCCHFIIQIFIQLKFEKWENAWCRQQQNSSWGNWNLHVTKREAAFASLQSEPPPDERNNLIIKVSRESSTSAPKAVRREKIDTVIYNSALFAPLIRFLINNSFGLLRPSLLRPYLRFPR